MLFHTTNNQHTLHSQQQLLRLQLRAHSVTLYSQPYTTFQLQPFSGTDEFMSTIQNLKTFGKPNPSFSPPLVAATDRQRLRTHPLHAFTTSYGRVGYLRVCYSDSVDHSHTTTDVCVVLRLSFCDSRLTSLSNRPLRGGRRRHWGSEAIPELHPHPHPAAQWS